MTGSPRARRSSVDWVWLGKVIPRGALAGLALGWLLAFVPKAGPHPASGGWGGDYPAFHTAGRLVLSGQGGQLYDMATQRALESEVRTDGFLPFLYPAFVAGFYAPLALLPYRASYLAFTLISVAALFGAIRSVTPLSATVRRDRWLAAAAVVCFYPMLRSFLGGQTVALGLLILCAAWRLLQDRRDFVGGLVLGLLAYKPQYLLPIAGVVLLSGRYRSMAGVGVSCAGLYAAGAAIAGWNWPATWLAEAQRFSVIDRDVNAIHMISLDRLLHVLGGDALWVIVVSVLSGWVAWIAWRHGRDDFAGVFAFTIPASVLIAPHALYYDFGLALPALLVLADRGRRLQATLLWLAGALQLLAPYLAISPLIAVAVTVLAFTGLAIRRTPAPGTS